MTTTGGTTNGAKGAQAGFEPGAELWAVVNAIWRRKGLGFLVLIVVVLGAGAYTALSKQIYRATSSVLIENKVQQIVPNAETGVWLTKDVTKAQRSLAMSLPVMKRAAEIAGATKGQKGDGKDRGSPFSGQGTSARIDGQLLSLTVTSEDPKRAAGLANAWSNAFVEEMTRRDRSGSVYTHDFLEGKLPELRKKWQESQRKLHAFRLESNFDPKGLEDSPVTQRVRQYSLDLADKGMEVARLRSRVKAWEAAKEDLDLMLQMRRASEKKSILIYHERMLRQARTQLVELRQRFLPNSKEVRKAEAALREHESLCRKELTAVAEKVRMDLMAKEEEEKELKRLYQEAKAEYEELKQFAFKDGVLATEAEMAKQQYEELARRHQESGVAGQVRFSYAQPWEMAEVPLMPYRPSWPRNMALGLLLGLLLAGVSIYVVELLDDSVHSAQQLQEFLGLKVIGSIPLLSGRKLKKHSYILARNRPHLPTVEGLRIVRSGLMVGEPALPEPADQQQGEFDFNSDREGQAGVPKKKLGKVVLVTSACQLDGKTFLSSNLSLLFALEDKNVLLIDGDLHKAKVTRIHGMKEKPGLGDLRDGPLKLSEIVHPTKDPFLSVLPAGKRVPSPASIIENPHLPALLQEARERYDVILIDSAPMLSVADAGVLARLCDQVVVAVRSRVTRQSQAQRTAEVLKRVGAKDCVYVLNGVSAADARYDGYYYGYPYEGAADLTDTISLADELGTERQKTVGS